MYFCNFLLYSIGFDYGYQLKPIFFKHNCNIYQGHSADLSVYFSKIILPSLFVFEKSVCYLNIMGNVKKSTKVLSNSFKENKTD
jgi:hypothetical protein